MSEEKEEQQSATRPTTVVVKDTGDPNEPKVGKPVDVNSNLTPITRKEVPQVNADEWPDLSISELQEQQYVLGQRLRFAQQIGHIDMVNQIRSGLIRIQAIIKEKSPDEIKLI